jgi:hypothetical protein
MRALLVIVAVTFLVACERRQGLDAVATTPSESKVQTVLAIEADFASTHPNKGVNAQIYTSQLGKEGFKCRAQYRRTAKFDERGAGSVFNVPTVVCVKAPANIDPCVEFTVALDFKNEGNVPLRTLVDKLHTLKSDEAVFLCEVTSSGPDLMNKISDGIKRGYIVPLDQ